MPRTLEDLNQAIGRLDGQVEDLQAKLGRIGTVGADINAILSGIGSTINPGESTTSSAYTDLATVGPAVTVPIGASGKALIVISAQMYNNTAGQFSIMSFAVSGASAIAATDNRSLVYESSNAGDQMSASKIFLLTDIAAGSNTFTCKYRAASGTANFLRRHLAVIPIGA